jgi:RNA polymerase primary sigma factor
LTPETHIYTFIFTLKYPALARMFSSSRGLDSFDQYLQDVEKYPLIQDPEEERALARRARTGDKEAAERLVTANLRFVISYVKKYQGRGLGLAELVCIGNEGLLKAVKKFDPDKGVKFISYAVWWIRQTVLQALAEQTRSVRIPLNQNSNLAKLARVDTALTQQLGRSPPTRRSPTRWASRWTPSGRCAGWPPASSPWTRPSTGRPRQRQLRRALRRGRVHRHRGGRGGHRPPRVPREMFEKYLTERERKILYLYYGLDDGEERTLEEIGSLLGVTRERIRQIRNRAFEKLRESPHGESLSGLLERELTGPGLGHLGAQSGEPSGRAPAPTWNDPYVLRLVERARDLRHSASVDPELRSYQARARGHVYFFVDRPDSDQRVLVKGDQVALDLYWLAPDLTKQWIVGQRDEKLLPTSIRYHLDHLTVVQDDFGDYIRLGDGDEVEAVVHPVGPSAEEVYDFMLSDSLTISYAGGAERIRVYEVRVRPKDLRQPGFVGTMFLDRDRAAIVRMNFSFTPESYVDPYLDYIRISLDNSLWMGRFWLPYRQEIEIRREMPVLDFQAGSTIRTKFDIRGYDFNVDIPAQMLAGPTVSTVSLGQRQAFLFEGDIFDALEEEGGLAPSPAMEEVQAQVRQVVEDEVMSGLAPIRLHLARLSDFARYNRAEGLRLGGGVTLRPGSGVVTRMTGGYAIGRERFSGTMSTTRALGALQPTVDLYWDGLGDIGGHPGATTLENTITSLSGKKDYTDPFFRRGATLTLRGRDAGGPV